MEDKKLMVENNLYKSEFKNNFGAEFKIIEEIRNIKGKIYYKILFKNYGFGEYETKSQLVHIQEGIIKNPYFPLVCTVGCYGVPNRLLYDEYSFLKIRQRWYNMIRRCYEKTNKDFKTYGNKGVTVCKRWLCFEYFLEDFNKIEGYDEYFLNKVLDKDLKNGVEYNIYNCKLITPSENSKEVRKRTCQYSFKAISPEGVNYISNNQRQFSFTHNLDAGGINECLKNRRKNYKGWKFEVINFEN